MKNFTLKVKQLFAAMMMLACIPASAQFTATVEQYANSDYASVAAEFKLTEIATALETDTATLAAALNAWYNYDEESGAEQPADMFFLKSGDQLISDYNTNAPGGFWMTSECGLGSYGVDAVFYEDIWFDSAEDFFGIYLGQYPDALAEGATLTPSFVLKHGEKQATFDVTYIVKKLPDMPETELEIAKLEIVGETEVTVDQYPAMSWKAYTASVSLAGVAETFGVEKEIFPTMIPSKLYQAYVDQTYGLKVDSLIAITVNDGWGRVVMSEQGDTLTEVCSANYGNLSDLKAFYTNGWSFDAETETLTCNMGQYPERMVVGYQCYSYVYLVYGNKAFRIKYILNVIEDPNAIDENKPENYTEVGRSVYRVEQLPNNDYKTSAITVNTDSIATLLGCEVSDMAFQAIDNKGYLSTNSTANNGGYWMTQGGIICGWGTNAYFFVEPATANDFSQLNTGQMPGNTAVGEEGHTLLYLTAGSNCYVLDITLAIIEEEKPDVEFESVATRSFTVQQLLNTGYAWSEQTASLPFEQINNLIGTTEPVLYALNIDSIAEKTGNKYTKDYTCTPYPGFWLTSDGRRTGWGSSSTWGISSAAVSSSESYTINCIQYQEGVATGDVFNGEFFLVNEETGKMITINLTYQIVDELIEHEVVGEEWIYLPVSTDDASVSYDLTKVATAFGLENVSDLFEGYYVKGLKADGTYTEGLDVINSSVNFNTSGAADTYGDIGVYFSGDYTQICTYSNVELDTPFKAEATMCFEIDSKQYIIHITLLDPDSYTGIESISAAQKDGKIYNLQGQEVAAPAKGIYIMNGKKFIVK